MNVDKFWTASRHMLSIGREYARLSCGVERVSTEPSRTGAFRLLAHAGEVVGFAGLDGHGQRRTLLRVFEAEISGKLGAVRGRVAYVSGDRNREGVFALWSVAHNLTNRC